MLTQVVAVKDAEKETIIQAAPTSRVKVTDQLLRCVLLLYTAATVRTSAQCSDVQEEHTHENELTMLVASSVINLIGCLLAILFIRLQIWDSRRNFNSIYIIWTDSVVWKFIFILLFYYLFDRKPFNIFLKVKLYISLI